MSNNRLFLAAGTVSLVMLLVTLFVWIPGCQNEPGIMIPDGPGSGTLMIKLTDAPFPFDLVDSATVTIDSLSAHVAAEDSALSGHYILSREQETFNLLDLQNGVTATLASATLPVGFVNQLRLFVSSARVVLTDARYFDLIIPSGEESGLKIHPDPQIEIVGSLTTEVILDFDVSRSFRAIPSGPDLSQIEGFHFRPTLRAVNSSEVGSLSGTVVNDMGTPDDSTDDTVLEGVTITAYFEGEEVTSTSTDASGGYRVMGLPAGSYQLESSSSGFEPEVIHSTVIPGNDVGGNDFVLSRTPYH